MAPIRAQYSFPPYTAKELAALPFDPVWKAILKKWKVAGIVPSEYFWWKDELFKLCPSMTPEMMAHLRQQTGGPGWENMSVKDQCELFQLDLRVTDASKFSGIEHKKKPYSKAGELSVEQFALNCYRAQGWTGHFDEGLMWGTISDVVSRKMETADNVFHRWDEHGEQVGGDVLTPSQVQGLNKAIGSVTDDQLIKAVTRIQKQSNTALDPSSGTTICAAWKILGPERLFRMLEAEMVNFGTSGWPDLVLIKGDEMRFVEVKSKKDFFRRNQAMWLRNFYKPMNLPLQVLHLVD